MEETYDIFVGSLLSCVTQESLQKLFENFGKIVKIKIMEKSTSKGLRYAFVHFSQEESALKAIAEMNDFMYSGVPLQVWKSDRWLKRTGKGTGSKGNVVKKTSPILSISSESIGVWEPPQLSNTAPRKIEKADVTNTAKIHTPDMCQANSKILKEPIAVTHVEDPVTFYAYFATKNQEINSLTKELQEICPGFSPLSGLPNKDQIYASVYSADKQWYRCKIIKVDPSLSRSQVQYIDFGNMENVSNSSLVELPPRLQIVSPFGMKCVMKNLVIPPKNQTLYDEGLRFIKSNLIDNIVEAVLHVVGNGSHLLVSELYHNGCNLVEMMIKKDYVVHILSTDVNSRNSLLRSGKGSTSNSKYSQGLVNSKPKNAHSPEVKTQHSHQNNMFNQEKAHLIAEIKKLKMDNAKVMGKNKALETELHSLNRSLAQPNLFTELPSVISEIEKVRLLRQQLPVRPECIDYIDRGVSLLNECDNGLKPLDKQYRDKIQNDVSLYHNIQETILDSSSQEELTKLIEDRKQLQDQLIQELKSFCTAIHSEEVHQRLQTVKIVLSEIKTTYKPFLDIKMFSQSELPLEELHGYYTSTKKEKAKILLEAQQKSNLAHRNFFKALQPASQNLEQRQVPCTSMPELTSALKELKVSLADEAAVSSMAGTPEASILGIISNMLCDKLEQELTSVEEIGFLEKQYTSLMESLSLVEVPFPPSGIQQLAEKRKERKKLKSQLRHILADKMDLEENEDANESDTDKINQRLIEVRKDLHRTFCEEDKLIASTAQLQDKVFPELNSLYPDLGLREYNKYKGVVKSGLEIEHFDLQPAESAISSKTHYSSTFMGESIRLEEYQLSNEMEKEELLECIIQYKAVNHPNLLPVHAVFFTKKFIHAYVMQPLFITLQSYVELERNVSPLKKNKLLHPVKIICILKGILQALSALHARGLVHGCLHPTTVFINSDNEPILDSFSFQPHKPCGHVSAVNGMAFQDTRTGNCNPDIYAFACLSLWLMYPESEFHLNEHGNPILNDLPLDGGRAELLNLVHQIIESPKPAAIQACDILNHPALNQDPDSFNFIQVADILVDSNLEPSDDPALPNEIQIPLVYCENDIKLLTRTQQEKNIEYNVDVQGNTSEDDESDNQENVLAYDSIRMNLCSLQTETSQDN